MRNSKTRNRQNTERP